MIQYKLISEYPGSPILGTIDWYKNDGGYSTSSINWLGTNFYDAHPKFWQKVEELDYDILSFYSGHSDDKMAYIFTKTRNGLYSKGTGDCDLNHALKYWHIHSVKRLSDGEVFTIGDEISTGYFTKHAKIDRIAITTINYQLQGIWVSYKGGSCALSGITKAKKTPLFTTEDGVGISIDDKYYAVDSEFKIERYFLCSTPNGKKQFSTKEKAEEYILLNKPCLSLNDVSKYYKALLSFSNGNSMGLRNLVKSKL